ncbi:MAG: hypothetical protein ACODAE_01650, partial [Gemmatimonadota bacterium]
PLVLSAVVSYRTLPDERSCPICASDTVPLLTRRRWLARLSALKPGAAVQRRWCMNCGWEGLCRLDEPAPPALPRRPTATADHSSADGPRASASPIAEGPLARAIDLRRLEVDGRRWRVLLQTWCDAQRWYGRLLFTGPSGKLWADRGRTFTGSSPLDVLGQALSLSDGMLTSRLRDVTSSAP